MFSNLDEQIKSAQGRVPAMWSRMLQHAGVLVVTGVLFGALYVGMLFLE